MQPDRTTTEQSHFLGLQYASHHISAFFQSGEGLFLLALKDRVVTHFYPENPESFLQWLRASNIREVK